MAWAKPSDRLVSRFEHTLPDSPGVERRQVFGMPCAFVNGNMFVGRFEERLMVRLDEPGNSPSWRPRGVSRSAPQGRPMKECLVAPSDIVAEEVELGGWVDRAFRFASTLPAKQPRPNKAKRA